jgi:RND superfamily putative drug exporter
MFQLLGRTVRRAWLWFLAGWVLLAGAAWLASPPWDQVAQDREFAFLPADAPSRRSEQVFARAFPEDHLASNVVLVLHHQGTDGGDAQQDLKFIGDVLEPGLRDIADAEGGLASETAPVDEPLFGGPAEAPPPSPPRSIMARIRTPNTPGLGALLVSEDQQVMLVVVELTTEFLSASNWPTITKIETLVEDVRRQGKLPPSVKVAVTGSAVIGRDHTAAQLQSVHATEVLTMVLVIGLLILIYRAPLLALIPLATVFLAVQIAVNVLAIAASAGYLTLFQGIQIYITILAYGAGVDYCLFLMARYQEELDAGRAPPDAVASAVGDVGAPLTASAVTVICGIGMMVLAQFGKFREAGVAIPLSLCLVLLATLTFSPSLLRLAGRWAFWPQRPGDREGPTLTGRLRGWRRFFDPGVLRRDWAWVGDVLQRRPGSAWMVCVAGMLPFVIGAGLGHNHLSYDVISDLPKSSPSVQGTQVLQEHFPAGILGPVQALLVNPHLDFGSPQGRAVIEQVTDRLHERQQDLGLADVRSLTAPLGVTSAAQRGLASFQVSPEARREVVEKAARERYLTDLGERQKIGTRLDLVLTHAPFSHQSIVDLNRVEQALRAALPPEHQHDFQLSLAGPTASVRDLRTVIQGDRTRIEWLVLVSVFLVLILLLRQVLVPLYLLVSVLFSYYATLGVTFALFWLLDPHGFSGIDWKVAIFLFTILIAVGEDYNIFLISRVHEEQRVHGPVQGITEALTRTGPIISSCGIIMAGTFASLLGGSLNDMKQLGFALAFGVLLDTFVVRPILVPSFLILLYRGRQRLWASGTASPSSKDDRRREM